MNQCGALAK